MCIRDSSSKARLYKTESDGFVLLFTAGEINEKNYQQLMSAIIEHIESNPVRYNLNNFIYITLSGSVVCHDPAHSANQLLTYASIARKIALKENKKFLRYSKEMHKEEDYAHNISWIKKIKEALEQDRIVPFFQPIIDTRTGTITKYESLVRLIEDDGKVLSPFFFLDIAKKARLYARITQVVIDKSFVRSKEMPEYEFSVNITAEDIYDIPTARYILEKLKTHPHPGKIIFEITESEEIGDYAHVNDFIAKLRKQGARIAIDDFGSGYASFEHILALKPDFIKIDGSLIKNIDTDEESRIVTEAIIAFSKKLGSKTVVEFVHNESVYRKIIELGADFAQGFHLGEPQKEPAEKILESTG
jgi:EAL domain-containing protein (putative c-di-GMP-specific phosphodiesterase class I)